MNNKRVGQFWRENRGFIVFFSLMLFMRSSFADWYHIPSASMQPNLITGDRVLVNKMAYRLDVPFTDIAVMNMATPERGDIVVFNSEAADKRMIKRVIGIPGDVVSMHNNQLMVNDKIATYESEDELIFSEVIDGHKRHIQLNPIAKGYGDFAPVIVPKNHLLVLGDNRNNSADSRYYGFIPIEEVAGKALKVIASFNPDNFYIPRKDRFLKNI